MHDEVELIGQHVAVGGEVPLLVVLTAHHAHPQASQRRAIRRSGSCTAYYTALAARLEAIPIVTAGLEARWLDVHRMRPVGRRVVRAVLYDRLHSVVCRDRPIDSDDLLR